MHHYETHEILTDHQHGFRPGRSCETQLVITTNDIIKALDERKQVDAIILDFSKAFDRVPHHRLLAKLSHYGIKYKLLTWMENFLTKRSQRVVVDGESSDWIPVTSGVPQGTVLGPLLFLSFINDLPCGISSNIRLFADDCLLYRPISNTDDTKVLQNDLDTLHRWSQRWQMKFNVEKCNSMTFTLRRGPIKANYHMGTSLLSVVTETTYLGLTLTCKMSWSKHISGATARANRILGLLRRNLRGSSQKIKECAYLALVRPHLEYCSSVWNPYSSKDIAKIESIQRQAARFVLNKYQYRESVSAMINELNWLSLEKRRQIACLNLLYKIKTNQVAINPLIYLQPMSQTITRASHPDKFKIIPTRTQLYQNSFFPRTIVWWNGLPPNIITSTSYEAFKVSLGSLDV